MDDEQTYMILVRGHVAVTHDDGHTWYWEDSGNLIVSSEDADDVDPESFERPCKRCGQFATPDGHDACISGLPGVANACCGHGVDPPYIQFDDERIFARVVEHLRTLKEEDLR